MLVIFDRHLDANDKIEYPDEGLDLYSYLTQGNRKVGRNVGKYDLYAVCSSRYNSECKMRRDNAGVWRTIRDEGCREEAGGSEEGETCVLFYKRRPQKR